MERGSTLCVLILLSTINCSIQLYEYVIVFEALMELPLAITISLGGHT